MRVIVDTKIRTSIYTDGVEVLQMISYAPLYQTMKKQGISTYRLGKKGFPMSTYYAMRRGENISTHTLNQLCKLLQCRVEDILEYVDEDTEQG